MKIKVKTENTVWPVTTPEGKAHLNVFHDEDDTLIESKIKTATLFLEKQMQVTMGEKVYELYLDDIPDDEIIRLPYPPVTSLDKIEYYPDGNTSSMSEFDLTKTILDDVSKPAEVHLSSDESWMTHEEIVNAIKVTFTAGYDSASDIPENWKDAVKLVLAHLYYNRGDEGHRAMMKTVHDLINNDSIFTI